MLKGLVVPISSGGPCAGLDERVATVLQQGGNDIQIKAREFLRAIKPYVSIADLAQLSDSETDNVEVASTIDDARRNQIISLLPQRCQANARIILTSTGGKLKMEPTTQKIVYPDGELGSNIIDLLRAFSSSPYAKRMEIADLEKFVEFLRENGVPENTLAYGSTEYEFPHKKIKWMH